jgi:hypothetical protein
MMKIEFEAEFPDGLKKIEVSAPHGAGAETYHVNIDNYYNGVIIVVNDEWRILLHPTTILTGDDVQILIDLIEKSKLTNVLTYPNDDISV